MRVINDNYRNMYSPSIQPQGNVTEASPRVIVYWFVCRRCDLHQGQTHISSSNDTKDSLALYLAQQLINQSNAENMVTVTHRNVMTKLGKAWSTGVST